VAGKDRKQETVRRFQICLIPARTYYRHSWEYHKLEADVVFVAIGRRPYTEGLGLEIIRIAIEVTVHPTLAVTLVVLSTCVFSRSPVA
jgi:hypothetical protein